MLRDKDPRFKGLEIKIGVMVAAALAGIVIIIALVGIEKDLFSAKYRVYFVTNSGSGFMQGMPVKLSGFRIGRVKGLELTGDARVKVTLEINRKYEKWIRDGSRARLAKEGFIGDSFVEMTTGSGRVIAQGEMIPYEKAGGIEELVEQAKPVLNEVKDIIHYANSPEGDIKVTLKNIRELTGELKETRRTFEATLKETSAVIRNADRLVGNLDEKSSNTLGSAERAMRNVEALTERIGPVMTRIEAIAERTDSASARLPDSIDKMDRILENVRAVSDVLAGEAPRMREILINSEEAAREGKRIVKGVRQSWPVRLMVPEPSEPGLVPLDGYLFERGADEG